MRAFNNLYLALIFVFLLVLISVYSTKAFQGAANPVTLRQVGTSVTSQLEVFSQMIKQPLSEPTILSDY